MSGIMLPDAPTAHLDAFVDYVTPAVHTAPTDIVHQMVRRAAIDFCRSVPVLRDDVLFDGQAGVNDYVIESSNPNLTVRAIEQVVVGDGAPLGLLPSKPLSRSALRGGIGFWFTAPSQIIITPAPSVDEPEYIAASVICIPTPEAEVLPYILYEQYGEALGDGCLSRLLLMKTADWYDPQAAGIHLRRFAQAKTSARQHHTRGSFTGPIVAQGTRWV